MSKLIREFKEFIKESTSSSTSWWKIDEERCNYLMDCFGIVDFTEFEISRIRETLPDNISMEKKLNYKFNPQLDIFWDNNKGVYAFKFNDERILAILWESINLYECDGIEGFIDFINNLLTPSIKEAIKEDSFDFIKDKFSRIRIYEFKNSIKESNDSSSTTGWWEIDDERFDHIVDLFRKVKFSKIEISEINKVLSNDFMMRVCDEDAYYFLSIDGKGMSISIIKFDDERILIIFRANKDYSILYECDGIFGLINFIKYIGENEYDDD